MPFLEQVIFRLLLWIGLPLALVTLAVGPARMWRSVKQGWNWLTRRKLAPEEIINQVLQQHQQHVAGVRKVIAQAEQTHEAIRVQLAASRQNESQLEAESRRLAAAGDDLGARAVLYKLNLERTAIAAFEEQLARQQAMIDESRQRLYLLELQLRQYEVGRSILLSQLAEAEKVEEQYVIARDFDPFNAVADWRKAEGMVLEKQLNARAMERVYADTRELAAGGQAAELDRAELEAQLALLRAELARQQAAAATPPGQEARPQSETPDDDPPRRSRDVDDGQRRS